MAKQNCESVQQFCDSMTGSQALDGVQGGRLAHVAGPQRCNPQTSSPTKLIFLTQSNRNNFEASFTTVTKKTHGSCHFYSNPHSNPHGFPGAHTPHSLATLVINTALAPLTLAKLKTPPLMGKSTGNIRKPWIFQGLSLD